MKKFVLIFGVCLVFVIACSNPAGGGGGDPGSVETGTDDSGTESTFTESSEPTRFDGQWTSQSASGIDIKISINKVESHFVLGGWVEHYKGTFLYNDTQIRLILSERSTNGTNCSESHDYISCMGTTWEPCTDIITIDYSFVDDNNMSIIGASTLFVPDGEWHKH